MISFKRSVSGDSLLPIVKAFFAIELSSTKLSSVPNFRLLGVTFLKYVLSPSPLNNSPLWSAEFEDDIERKLFVNKGVTSELKEGFCFATEVSISLLSTSIRSESFLSLTFTEGVPKSVALLQLELNDCTFEESLLGLFVHPFFEIFTVVP